MGRGDGKTSVRVIELLKKEVAELSQAEVSRRTGLGLATINDYLKGKGEPTSKTLKKLSDYFGVSVAWLRGDVGNFEDEIVTFVGHNRAKINTLSDEELIDFISMSGPEMGSLNDIALIERKLKTQILDMKRQLENLEAERSRLEAELNLLKGRNEVNK